MFGVAILCVKVVGQQIPTALETLIWRDRKMKDPENPSGLAR